MIGGRKTNAVRRSAWDVADWEEAAEAVGRLAQAAEELGALSPAGAELVPDTFTSFLQHSPVLEDPAEMQPSHRPNRAVMDQLMGADAWNELRDMTVGDPLTSAMAAVTVQSKIKDLVELLGPAREEAQRAQRTQDLLDELLDGQGGDEELPPEVSEQIEELTQELDAANAAVEEAVGRAEPVIGRSVRNGLRAAIAEAEENEAMIRSWGLEPGEVARKDASERLKLAARMKTDRMRRIAALLGAIRNLAFGQRQRKHAIVPDEVHGVTLGDDLSRLLPSEALGLVVPELEWDFLRRLADRQLLIYELEGTERVGQGGIIFVEDNSGSMSGAREELAKAVGGALLSLAREEGRSFTAICFGGAGAVHTFHFPTPESFTIEAILDYMEFFLDSGGTEFCGPLDEAVSILQAEFEASGHVSGDIVFCTDGAASVPDQWLLDFKRTQEALDFNVVGMGIGVAPGRQPFTAICSGRVFNVADLTSGEDVLDVFAAVA